MKRKILMMICVGLSAVWLTACGTTDNEKPQGDTQQQQSEDESDDKETTDDKTQSRDALDAEEEFETPEAKPADLADAETVTVNIYYADEQAENFLIAQEEINTLDIGQILEKLAEHQVLPQGMTFNSLRTEEEEGVKVVYLDMQEDFSQHLLNQGTSGEYMVLGSLVNTVLDAFDSEKVQITAGGAALESGHAEYPEYFTRYGDNSGTDAGEEADNAE